MPNFHIASITLYSQECGINLSTTTSSSSIPPSTISISTSNSSLHSTYSGPTSTGVFQTSGSKFTVGGSGGGNLSSRTGHHSKYQQGLNNRTSDLELLSNLNDNDRIDNPMDDLNVLAKEDFFTWRKVKKKRKNKIQRYSCSAKQSGLIEWIINNPCVCGFKCYSSIITFLW